MPERRYSKYKRSEVWNLAYQLQSHHGYKLVDGTVQGNSVSLLRKEKQYKAIILARSSDWYYYRLNFDLRIDITKTVVITATHDSCLPVHCLAFDAGKWYKPGEARIEDLSPANTAFDKMRKTEYGHNILVGALMQERPDAIKRLLDESFKASTRWRIEAELRQLRRRKVGRPLVI